MLADAGAPVLVTQRRCSTGCPRGSGRRDRAARRRLAADRPRSPRQPAAVTPRSAQPRLRDLHLGLDRNAEGRRWSTHGGLEQLPRRDAASGCALEPDDRLLAVTTIGFDIAALELYLPLLRGACVVRRAARDACRIRRRWRATIATDRHATVMQATPTLWQSLLEREPATRCRTSSSLRC